MFNLVAAHHQLYDIKASWQYFESGHDKGACDGIGGVAKRMADNAIKTGHVEIHSAREFYKWASTAQSQIKYLFIEHDDYVTATEENESRQSDIVTVKGTMKFHTVSGINRTTIMARETTCCCNSCFSSWDGFIWREENTCNWTMHSLRKSEKEHATAESDHENVEGSNITNVLDKWNTIQEIENTDYIAAIYDSQYFIGQVIAKDESEFHVSFMEQCGKLRTSFKWPKQKDELWIQKKTILCTVAAPQATGKGKRMFKLTEEDWDLVEAKYNQWKKSENLNV